MESGISSLLTWNEEELSEDVTMRATASSMHKPDTFFVVYHSHLVFYILQIH